MVLQRCEFCIFVSAHQNTLTRLILLNSTRKDHILLLVKVMRAIFENNTHSHNNKKKFPKQSCVLKIVKIVNFKCP